MLFYKTLGVLFMLKNTGRHEFPKEKDVFLLTLTVIENILKPTEVLISYANTTPKDKNKS